MKVGVVSRSNIIRAWYSGSVGQRPAIFVTT